MEKVVMQWWGLRELILLVTIKRVSRGASPPKAIHSQRGNEERYAGTLLSTEECYNFMLACPSFILSHTQQ